MVTKQATLEDYGFLIHKNISGSVSQGTNLGSDLMGNVLPGYENHPRLSDVDVTGIFVPHKKHILGTRRRSLYPEIDHWEEWGDPRFKDHRYISLPKFARLLYECNPNITEQLFVRPEHILFINEYGQQLRDMAPFFITKQSFEKFASFARRQAILMERGHNHSGRGLASSHAEYYKLSGEESFDLKAFSHLLRLMLHIREMLTEGTLSTYLREADRQAVIRVKHFGLHPWKEEKLTLSEAHRIADVLYAEMQEHLLTTTIPDVPDFDRLNTWVSDTIERVNGGVVFKQNYASAFKILPLEHQMIEDTTLLLVSRPLSPRRTKSDAFGVCVPYRDFFTGLRSFKQATLGSTKIDSLHKALNRMENCNPTLIDLVFAGKEHVLHERTAFTSEMKHVFKSVITTNKLYNATMGVAKGILRVMRDWEKQKVNWETEKEAIAAAKQLSEEDWSLKRQALDERKEHTIQLFFNEGPAAVDKIGTFMLKYESDKLALASQVENWYQVKDKKLTKYPPCPAGTDPVNSAYMHRFGYDTVQAAFVYHVLSMAIELLETGTLEDSRKFEREMILIKEGSYESFETFETKVHEMIEQIEKAKQISPLPNEVDHQKVEDWIIDFVERFHCQS